MSIRLEPFRAGHVSDAASLAAAAVRRVRAEIPLLPAAWESAVAIEPILADLAEAGSGVAAGLRGVDGRCHPRPAPGGAARTG
jgi:hypothetical protein